ncbi:GNAT family N-acetyltransferase [Amycolatopsis sp.]|uniref:GNAT family N-acetyltransferase n=1 Tax=Amycolatopsis sp. TaxID=37632 RepID=UPI002C74A793|nr:GNAT family N-acetyltransferase [Amycolatopsis sp.]HVV08488.1 GNAT family N-acetyltransferase [Amycolatopsis sp.]
MSSTERIDVRRMDDRYEITVDGQVAGFAAFADRGDERVMYHTEIDKTFGGRGLSNVLVTGALEDVRASGKHVVPVCPLVAKFLTKHPEFADLAHPVTGEIVAWLEKSA